MESNKLFTAVERFSNQTYELFEQYSEGKFDRVQLNKLMVDATNKAKEMEKEQIIDAFWNGDNTDCTSEQNSKEFAEQYKKAHVDYLDRRNKYGLVDEITEISAGGMPNRVKCLHALVAHSLAVGPGINPVGDDALVRLGNWATKACVKESE